MKKFYRGFIIFLYLIVLVRADRILFVMPHPQISHQIAARSLTNSLLKEAEVVMVTPWPAYPAGGAPANLTEVDVSDTRGDWDDAVAKHMSGVKADSHKTGSILLAPALKPFFRQLKKPEVQKVFQQKFDVVIAEAIINPTIALARICNAPLVHFGTGGTVFLAHVEGSLTHYLYYPHSLRMRLHNLSTWEKFTEFFDYIYCLQAYGSTMKNYWRLFKETFPQYDTQGIEKEVQMTLLNTNVLWDGNRPKPLTVVYIGGIHNPPQKDLPQDLKSFIDSSIHGVVYMSFGTSCTSSRLPADRIRVMVRVLARMPFHVLWKWDGDLPETARNVRVAKWYPQADLLRHPNIKLFITQAGWHSTEEAINGGVPMVAIPLQADQWYQAEKIVHFGIGERIDLSDITEDSFKSVVEAVLHNKTYRVLVSRLRALLSDRPQSPAARARWALRRAGRRAAGALLRSPSAHLPLSQYYELDLIAVALLVLLFAATLTFVVLRRLLAYARTIGIVVSNGMRGFTAD